MGSRTIPVDPFDLVIIGGTGDLARRKILPGLFRRFCAGQMSKDSQVIGAARTEMDTKAYRKMVRDSIAEFGGDEKDDKSNLDSFLKMIGYVTLDAKGDQGWADLSKAVSGDRVSAFYFSVGPSLFGDLAERLQKHGMAGENCRIVVEKPFGRDLKSAVSRSLTFQRVTRVGMAMHPCIAGEGPLSQTFPKWPLRALRHRRLR